MVTTADPTQCLDAAKPGKVGQVCSELFVVSANAFAVKCICCLHLLFAFAFAVCICCLHLLAVCICRLHLLLITKPQNVAKYASLVPNCEVSQF